MEFYTYVVEPEDIGKRIDAFLSDELEEISRSRIQKLIDEHLITLNKSSVKSNYKLRVNDIIDVTIPAPVELTILPEEIDLDILYEDKDLIVINKPKDMVVHPAAGHYSKTLVNGLLYHCGDSLSGINGVMRPGIVHRIDKDTSGVIVVAKNDFAHAFLSEQLAKHEMTRRYHAIVFNNIADDTGTVDKPIGRHPVERKKMAVTKKNSRNAVTHYKVLARFGRYTYIEASLETGRTHQIRVHMSSIGHPLLGDTVYGSSKQFTNLNGQALHAKVLGFIHPTTKEYMEFETELPDYFKRLIESLH